MPAPQLGRSWLKMPRARRRRDEEREIVRRHGRRSAMPRVEAFGLKAVADGSALAQVREAVTQIRLSDPLVDYIVDGIRATREHSSLEVGASTPAAHMLAAAARAFPVLAGRGFGMPGGSPFLALPV